VLTSTSGFFTQDTSFGNNQNGSTTEFLFEFFDEGSFLGELLENTKLWDWHEDDDACLTFTEGDFLGRGDVHFTQRSLQLFGVDLEVIDGLCD